MAKLTAVPDRPNPEGTDPPDWPELRASFSLAMRSVRRSPRTISTYLEGCDKFAAFLAERSPGRLIEEATRDDLRAFLVALEDASAAPNSVATRHRALRALFKFMTSEEIIAVNPMRAIPAPSIT
ncbi:MAG TPA: site-specific integrase, partial [Acidimicrobiia bacterium]|nr:site-specific integrase [Acidimicrobiia bacterium]